MENPEEVLQALDEFQKLKPAEIPRELEDYLCFVAKTGDPVYQWSLIKPLFREKLVRVMTDFYESCPTLDLASSPNIEQFNYDNMKGNLLDLLESFANAPFTVQRICELLTTPRKEYNRVDKFMRAIEKNILVVSTKEPGPTARRSENGDSMINGSIDEEGPNQQTPEVEMESWVKDCTADAALTQESLVVTVVPPRLLKDTEECLDLEKVEARQDVTTSFVTSQESTIHAPLTVQSHEPITNTVNSDVSSIVGDVPDAIMNEDTSSQPSLEAETDDAEPSSTRKLQTTFQSRDFVKNKEEAKSVPEAADEPEEKSEEPVRVENEKKTSHNERHQPDLSIEEPIVEKRQRLDDDVTQKTTTCLGVKEESTPEQKDESRVEGVVEPEQVVEKEETEEAKADECPEESKSKQVEEDVAEASRVIVEEPSYEESETENKVENDPSTVIQEAMDDDVKAANSMVPDPIPIIEEPKEEPSVLEEVTEEVVPEKCEEIISSVEKAEVSEISQCQETIINEDTCQASESVEKPVEPAECMEVDSEESTPAFPQDEPMEQESTDQLKS